MLVSARLSSVLFVGGGERGPPTLLHRPCQTNLSRAPQFPCGCPPRGLLFPPGFSSPPSQPHPWRHRPLLSPGQPCHHSPGGGPPRLTTPHCPQPGQPRHTSTSTVLCRTIWGFPEGLPLLGEEGRGGGWPPGQRAGPPTASPGKTPLLATPHHAMPCSPSSRSWLHAHHSHSHVFTSHRLSLRSLALYCAHMFINP